MQFVCVFELLRSNLHGLTGRHPRQASSERLPRIASQQQSNVGDRIQALCERPRLFVWAWSKNMSVGKTRGPFGKTPQFCESTSKQIRMRKCLCMPNTETSNHVALPICDLFLGERCRERLWKLSTLHKIVFRSLVHVLLKRWFGL